MATTIVLKNSVTTTNTPSSLAQGEVAINVTDKKVWVGNAATTPVQIVNGGPDGVFTSVTDSGLTNTRVTYAGAGGLLKDSANITTDGTIITAAFSGAHNGTVGATTPATGAFTTVAASSNLTFASGTNGVTFNNTSALVNSKLNDYETGTWTPTVIATSGTITTVGSTFGFYTKIGNLVSLVMELPITTNGTGAGAIAVTNLPFTMNNAIASYGTGREQNVTGWGLFGYISNSNNYLYIQKYDGAYPANSGYSIGLSIVYRATF